MRKRSKNTVRKWDVFIGHATEDKGDIARPLAQGLISFELKVWFDEFEIKVGDSITEKIEYGLTNSRFGVIILSKSFFRKQWPKKERNTLLNREMRTGRKVILPVWHGVNDNEVAMYSPILSDNFALKTQGGVPKVAEKIVEVIKGREYLVKKLSTRKRKRKDLASLNRYFLALLKREKIALFNKKRHEHYKISVDLHNRNLSNANLQGADLSEINLRESNLRKADLQYANLYGAGITGADLSETNLSHAALKHARMQEAKMEHSNFDYAYLDRADLQYANLTNASLKYISIVGADLRNATIQGANFYEAFGLPISKEEAITRGAIFSRI